MENIIKEIKALAMEHYDPDASLTKRSPADIHAWRNGLIVRLCDAAQQSLRSNQQAGGES